MRSGMKVILKDLSSKLPAIYQKWSFQSGKSPYPFLPVYIKEQAFRFTPAAPSKKEAAHVLPVTWLVLKYWNRHGPFRSCNWQYRKCKAPAILVINFWYPKHKLTINGGAQAILYPFCAPSSDIIEAISVCPSMKLQPGLMASGRQLLAPPRASERSLQSSSILLGCFGGSQPGSPARARKILCTSGSLIHTFSLIAAGVSAVRSCIDFSWW